MFRKAYAIASQYTWPVVLSRKAVAGQCSANIGTFVTINDEGWILTAAHIVGHFQKLADGAAMARASEAEMAKIEADASLDTKARKQRIRQVARPAKNDTDRCSAWWGRDECRIVFAAVNVATDLAVARLAPFDPTWVATYPTFKDPSKDFEPGVSLCKLGYPFHQITPQWDASADSFRFPPDTVPLPRFPMEGILTRIINIAVPSPPPYPLRMIETSSPGLRGQSGGPIFDQQGTIWGIQCQTVHWPLGFNPTVPGSSTGKREHQFLNAGVGAHPDTIFGMLQEQGIKFHVSPY